MAKILHIDDEPGILDIMKRNLERHGHEVISIQDPEKFKAMLISTHPDLLILDIEMPGVSGLELFDQIKLEHSEIPVLFATAHREAFDLDTEENIRRWTEGFADGLTDIIYKPFDFKIVQEKILSLVETAEME